MENGIYAACIEGETANAVFVDQERVDFSRLNRKSQQNYQQRMQEHFAELQVFEMLAAKKTKAREIEELKKRKLLRMGLQTVKHELILFAAMLLVYIGFNEGMVNIFFAVPVWTVLFALFCFKAGSFFGYVFRYRR